MRANTRKGLQGLTQVLKRHILFFLKSLAPNYQVNSAFSSTTLGFHPTSQLNHPFSYQGNHPSEPESHLILKKSKQLLSVSMADIPVLHSAEVTHFHHKSCCTYTQLNYSQNTSKVTRHENTMKPFEGSSNKFGLLGFQSVSRCRNPLSNGTIPSRLYSYEQRLSCTHLGKPLLRPFG